jgi:hypothetical protein
VLKKNEQHYDSVPVDCHGDETCIVLTTYSSSMAKEALILCFFK